MEGNTDAGADAAATANAEATGNFLVANKDIRVVMGRRGGSALIGSRGSHDRIPWPLYRVIWTYLDISWGLEYCHIEYLEVIFMSTQAFYGIVDSR